jgi:hypothetical protein
MLLSSSIWLLRSEITVGMHLTRLIWLICCWLPFETYWKQWNGWFKSKTDSSVEQSSLKRLFDGRSNSRTYRRLVTSLSWETFEWKSLTSRCSSDGEGDLRFETRIV